MLRHLINNMRLSSIRSSHTLSVIDKQEYLQEPSGEIYAKMRVVNCNIEKEYIYYKKNGPVTTLIKPRDFSNVKNVPENFRFGSKNE